MPGALGLMGVGSVPTVGGGFTDPSDIAGLAVWLDAGTLSLADADPVTTWADQSGNGRDFTQATSAQKPTYKTAIVNGEPVVRFDGTDDVVVGPNLSALTAATAFLVVKIDTEPPGNINQTGLWDFGTHTGSGRATHYPFTDSNVYDGFGSTARKSTGNPTAALTSWRIYEVKTVSGEWTSRVDGVQHFTTATNTVGFTTAVRIGESWSNDTPATRYYLDGDVAEFILYNSGLGTTDAGNVRSYLGTKYGITV